MKTKKIAAILAVVVVALAVIFTVFYLSPSRFLKGVEPSEVAYISVFDGGTGEESEVTDPEAISAFVEGIKAQKFQKSGISAGKMGYMFRLTFFSADGKELDRLIVNSDNTLRRDPFFYTCDSEVGVEKLVNLADNGEK